MLHDYQKYAVRYIWEHRRCAILLSMGLGKTVIALTAVKELIDEGEIRKVLVVAPRRVAGITWPAEIEKFDHLSGLTYSVIVGDEKKRLKALDKDVSVYIVNRDAVMWLAEQKHPDFDMIIIDELSSFKNHRTKRFQSMMKLRRTAGRIVALTGTPSSNGLMDLWAEFKVIDNGERLGCYIGQYRNRYFIPDKSNGYVIYSYRPKYGAEEMIYEAISDITISMKSIDHLDMPDLVSERYPVMLSRREKRIYEDMKKDYVIESGGGHITAVNAGVLSGKLMQLANGAVYDDAGGTMTIHDRKLDALEDLIESVNGRPVLIAYWYAHDQRRITERLDRIGIRHSVLDSDRSIREWNEGRLPVALIHPASAGHGLNLQYGGSALIWYGLTWSLELYQQTNARLWRQGQKDTVVIMHIIASGTIDEHIMEALESKDRTQASLIDALRAEISDTYAEKHR